MKNIIKLFHLKYGFGIRKLFRKLGYDIIKFKPEKMGIHAYYDMAKFIKSDNPILFDVGANEGQSIIRMREVFNKSVIHSFEPSPNTFDTLKMNTINLKNVTVWNFGVGSKTDQIFLNENNVSDMSSFLELGDQGWGKIDKKTSVQVITIDDFCKEQKISKIDILKLDTQGFEFEILKGAENSILENKIGLLFFEVTFLNLYEELPSLSKLYDFAVSHGFELVSFYPFHYSKNNMALGTDVLFKHKSYQ